MGMVDKPINRFEVWSIRLNPTEGSEQRGVSRPCVVISPQELIDNLSIVTVLPLTSQSRKTPFRISCTFKGREGLVLLEQIRTVTKDRFLGKMGHIGDKVAIEISDTLQEFFAY
nr:type II toxin-antitoxin system PemK/MazF family toxin [Piscirickettsia salmonis]